MYCDVLTQLEADLQSQCCPRRLGIEALLCMTRLREGKSASCYLLSNDIGVMACFDLEGAIVSP